MEVSFVELEKKTKEIIRALNRNERVTVLYRGKPIAEMHPIARESMETVSSAKDHPAFGLWKDRDDMNDVSAYVRGLRKGRFS